MLCPIQKDCSIKSYQYQHYQARPFKSVNLIIQSMSNTMAACNKHLSAAYECLQKGQLAQSIDQYNLAFKHTYSQHLKSNIKCTIAVLQYHLTKENPDEMLQAAILAQTQDPSNLITLRAIVNCILIDILEGRCNRAGEYFDALLEILAQEPCVNQRKSLVEYISYLFFRVRNFQEIPEYIENMDLKGMRVQEVFSISLMAFNSQLCKLESQQRVQRLCYDEFMRIKRYDLAIFCLRSLIRFTKNNLPNKEYYEKELAKLIMMGYFSDDLDYQNYESYEAIQTIVDKFILARNRLNEESKRLEMKNILIERGSKKAAEQPDNELKVEWKYTILMMIRELKKNKEMEQESKRSIVDILKKVKMEDNVLVIRSMTKNNYFFKYNEKVHTIFQSLAVQFSSVSNVLRESFDALKNLQSHDISQDYIEPKTKKSRLSLRSERSQSALTKMKTKDKDKEIMDKQNHQPLGISIVSITSSKISSKETGRKKIFQENKTLNTLKKVQKMVKMCEYGGFLNKRNYNSEGGQYRFVRITNSFIKWGKDPEKIETDCQIYPLKDIKSIIYGRVSPNLNENCNKMLSYSKCFSLQLQKRTLDFYCKNYEEIEGWVCGLSAALKKQQVRVVGYTPGKLRWKKMFAILKESFIEPLKVSERGKYYYENAYSLILFAKNGYRLRGQENK